MTHSNNGECGCSFLDNDRTQMAAIIWLTVTTSSMEIQQLEFNGLCRRRARLASLPARGALWELDAVVVSEEPSEIWGYRSKPSLSSRRVVDDEATSSLGLSIAISRWAVVSMWSISKGWLSVSMLASDSTGWAAINWTLHMKLASCACQKYSCFDLRQMTISIGKWTWSKARQFALFFKTYDSRTDSLHLKEDEQQMPISYI